MTILKLYRVGIPNVLTTEFNLQKTKATMSKSKAQLIDAMAKEADLSKAKAKQAIDLTL